MHNPCSTSKKSSKPKAKAGYSFLRFFGCKDCHQISSVTSHTQTIRCHGCSRIISVGNSQDSALSGGISRFLDFCSKPSRSTSMSSIKRLEPPLKGKRALLCGMSYKGQKFKLKGTTQDVLNMQKLLLHKFNFSADAFLILAEEDQFHLPTRENILDGFDWLTKNLQAGDSLVFYYSGHGLRTVDLKDEEVDGFDEAICPVDFSTKGMILDNEINEKLVQRLKERVTLHAIVDACHSGTVLDLPYVYNRRNGVWDPPHRRSRGTEKGKAICFSACEDYQQASDTSMFSTDNTVVGAMTYTFIQAVNEMEGPISYYDIIEYIHKAIEDANKNHTRGLRRFFRRQMLQDPILCSSAKFDIKSEFKL